MRSTLLLWLLSLALLLSSVPAAATEIPYGIDERPMPAAHDAETLLPEQIGDFHRGTIEGKLPGDEVYTTYRRRGSREIYLTVSIRDDADAARRAVATSAQMLKETYPDRDLPTATYEGDIAFVRVIAEDIRVFHWSRGKYFFSVDASRCPGGTLDAFMTVFPY